LPTLQARARHLQFRLQRWGMPRLHLGASDKECCSVRVLESLNLSTTHRTIGTRKPGKLLAGPLQAGLFRQPGNSPRESVELAVAWCSPTLDGGEKRKPWGELHAMLPVIKQMTLSEVLNPRRVSLQQIRQQDRLRCLQEVPNSQHCKRWRRVETLANISRWNKLRIKPAFLHCEPSERRLRTLKPQKLLGPHRQVLCVKALSRLHGL